MGCAKNTVDSMRLEQALRSARHARAETADEADLLIVNTCGFIDAARDQSIETIEALDRERRAGQQLYVVGCLTQIAESTVREAVPGIDATFGAEAWDAVAAAVGPATESYDIPQQPLGAGAPSAYLKISDGCDRPCTFCIIPTIKGRMRSVEADRLIAEARWHASLGTRELVLVAQDSTAYGEDQRDRDGLATLLERIAGAVPEVPWLRLMYAYPGRMTKRLAETMERLPNVVPYLDMPLQHGSDAVLRRMRRPGMRVAQRSLDTIRAAMPDVVLRTTFIVGFPGETEQEFDELLRFVEQEQFDHIGAFTYSPQQDTPAARFAEAVPQDVMERRYAELMQMAQQISLQKNRALLGEEIDVLVESEHPTEAEDGGPISIGRSWRDAPEVDGLAMLRGAFEAGAMVRARVDGALHYDLLCTPVGERSAAEPSSAHRSRAGATPIALTPVTSGRRRG